MAFVSGVTELKSLQKSGCDEAATCSVPFLQEREHKQTDEEEVHGTNTHSVGLPPTATPTSQQALYNWVCVSQYLTCMKKYKQICKLRERELELHSTKHIKRTSSVLLCSDSSPDGCEYCAEVECDHDP